MRCENSSDVRRHARPLVLDVFARTVSLAHEVLFFIGGKLFLIFTDSKELGFSAQVHVRKTLCFFARFWVLGGDIGAAD